jgi:hypothetical protein
MDLSKVDVTGNATFNYTPPYFSPDPLIDNEDDVIELLLTQLWNYPNPFNPETTIAFTIPSPTNVKIDIFNIRGQRVKPLVDENYIEGEHRVVWDGTDNIGRSVSSGIYFYRMIAGEHVEVRQMMLMK